MKENNLGGPIWPLRLVEPAALWQVAPGELAGIEPAPASVDSIVHGKVVPIYLALTLAPVHLMGVRVTEGGGG